MKFLHKHHVMSEFRRQYTDYIFGGRVKIRNSSSGHYQPENITLPPNIVDDKYSAGYLGDCHVVRSSQ